MRNYGGELSCIAMGNSASGVFRTFPIAGAKHEKIARKLSNKLIDRIHVVVLTFLQDTYSVGQKGNKLNSLLSMAFILNYVSPNKDMVYLSAKFESREVYIDGSRPTQVQDEFRLLHFRLVDMQWICIRMGPRNSGSMDECKPWQIRLLL